MLLVTIDSIPKIVRSVSVDRLSRFAVNDVGDGTLTRGRVNEGFVQEGCVGGDFKKRARDICWFRVIEERLQGIRFMSDWNRYDTLSEGKINHNNI